LAALERGEKKGKNNPVVQPQPTQYLFIDGACLYNTIVEVGKNFAGGTKLDVDFANLTAHFDKVFYYDALPSQHAQETTADFNARLDVVKAFHDRLATLDRFHVYEGDTRRSPSLRKQQQKKVDVMIAVDMLTHSFRRNMQRATLLASDVDFKPLLDALVAEGMFVTLWFPPNRTNIDLIKSADQRRRLDVRSIHPALMPGSQGLFSLPRVWGQQSRSGYINPVKSWKTDDGEFELFRSGNELVLVGPHDEIPGHSLYHAHHDLDFLKLYSREVLSSPIPD
jgi:uncharacterized LabA/DUF88 family protein